MRKDRYFGYVALTGALLASAFTCAESRFSESGVQPVGQGVLHVAGSFQEAPCQMAMRSKYQDIVMDGSAIANLRKPGDTGQPQKITFHFLACRTADGKNKLAGRGANIVFQSAADPNEPTLLRIKGVSGVGLRILDDRGRMVIPGQPVEPRFQSSNLSEMTYTVIPVRTAAPLTTGEFKATIDFGMRYE